MAEKKNPANNQKNEDLRVNTTDGDSEFMTTNQGVRVNDAHNSLKAGDRGPTLMEDFIFREKMTHFDHERIPERVVHARGSGAHGVFKLYESLEEYTKADFLTDTESETPVFTRFSTVVGFRGSTDFARDVRGFATKFYTREGIYDLVANNMPVFFIQDGHKFPDLVHSIKPEPRDEVPQATGAHDTFWDFISLMPESMHMIMWLMSDRAIPRSYRMMEGFGVNTFRLINEAGDAHFVKLHWKPMQGLHSVVWDEAQKISGMDPDFHRKDLWDAIEDEMFPEWELCMQIIPEEDEHKFPFDLLDPTKIVPEELVPARPVGKLTLNRNPDNFFAETEQVAFHPGHVVPGIDFTNDPLLQGRLFSYTDTQLIRLGGPNFHELPINRSISKVRNNQREGYGRQTINRDETSYSPNSISGGCPFQAKVSEGGFKSYTEQVSGRKIRSRNRSFHDHFSQAKLFYDSQAEYEKQHLKDALKFEIGKVKRKEIRVRMAGLLSMVNREMAEEVAESLGVSVPDEPEKPINHGVPADEDPNDWEPIFIDQGIEKSEALSMAHQGSDSIRTRHVAILTTHGLDGSDVGGMKTALEAAGAKVTLVAPSQGVLHSADGQEYEADKDFVTTGSVLHDALYIPGGQESVSSLLNHSKALHFINESYRHYKPVAASAEGIELLKASGVGKVLELDESDQKRREELSREGVVLDGDPEQFIQAILRYRFWTRKSSEQVPA